MAYCKFSSDDYGSDIWCVSENGVYMTRIADMKIDGEVPKLPAPTKDNAEEYLAAYKRQLDFVSAAERKPIGLPFDGKSFADQDLPSLLQRLRGLRELGYRVPEFALKRIEEEIAEQAESS